MSPAPRPIDRSIRYGLKSPTNALVVPRTGPTLSSNDLPITTNLFESTCHTAGRLRLRSAATLSFCADITVVSFQCHTSTSAFSGTGDGVGVGAIIGNAEGAAVGVGVAAPAPPAPRPPWPGAGAGFAGHSATPSRIIGSEPAGGTIQDGRRK